MNSTPAYSPSAPFMPGIPARVVPPTKQAPGRQVDHSVRVAHHSREWARVSSDGTVSRLNIEWAREHAAAAAALWMHGERKHSDVLALLVIDAYEMGRLHAARPQRVREM